MELLGVGAAEALLVLVVTLIVVGPHRFPEIARQGGKWYRIARAYARGVTADVRGAMAEIEAEVQEHTEDLRDMRELGEGMSDEAAAELRALNTEAAQLATDTQTDLGTVDAAATPAVTSDTAPDGDPGAAPDGGSSDEGSPPDEATHGPSGPVQSMTVLELPSSAGAPARRRASADGSPADGDADSGT